MRLQTTLLLLTMITTLQGQELVVSVQPFTKIVTSPHVNVVLSKGEKESVKIDHGDFPAEKINAEISGKTLRIYLDDARIHDRYDRSWHGRRNEYQGVTITAYITYRKLDRLEIRGNQDVVCNDPLIGSRKFKLKAYGENNIRLAALKTELFKAVLYGENTVSILDGRCDYQKYKLYGNNKIEATNLKCYGASATSFGENELRLFSQDELYVTAFGETRISNSGTADVKRGLIIGRADFSRR